MGRHNQNRWVRPSTVSNPERDQKPLQTPEPPPLEQREEKAPPTAEDDEAPAPLVAQSPPAAAPADPRSEREVRLAAARALQPEGAHWLRVWQQGRDAAVTALEGGATIAAAYALRPPEVSGCRDCWMRGRDAALRVIQGV